MRWTIAHLVLSLIRVSHGSVNVASGQVQMIDMQVLESDDDWQCASVEEKEKTRNKIHQRVDSVITTTFTMPTTAAVTTLSTMIDCSGPGWRHVAFVNMSDTSYNCPTGLNLTSHSKRTCGRSHTTYGGCSSTTFSVGGVPYSHVCGRIRGYQFGATTAFFQYFQGIDSYYVDGISLTHGDAGMRQHIWTFAAGATEVHSSFPNENCPCDTGNYNDVPVFVGNDFFCESGLHSPWSSQYILYPSDVLWDGQDCISASTCCQFNNPPWFTKNLPAATTDDIELRICADGLPTHDDIPIELIELYVQ